MDVNLKSGLGKIAIAIGATALVLVVISFFKKDDANSPDDKNSQEIENLAPELQDSDLEQDEVINSSQDKATTAPLVKDDFLIIPVSKELNIFIEIVKHLSKVDGLKRIILVDTSENTISVIKHLQQADIHFPADIKGKAGLYIYKGSNDLGPSEALLITNEDSVEANSSFMKNWEENIIADLKRFILIGEKYDLVEASGKKQFNDSSKYKNTRFINFTQDQAVSLNYTTGDSFILITNSLSIHGIMLKNISKENAL
ncbi:MAG: hypothetical protein U9Q72_00510 [Patescibacteria group bacterium]|nr:hypothetical protein [Patescibacteria group bacterium]